MARYRRRWGSDFSFEPIDVYQKKERERAKQLVESASTSKYGTDRVPSPRQLASPFEQAAQMAAKASERIVAKEPQPKRDGGGGGIFGRIKDVAGDVLREGVVEPFRDWRDQQRGNPVGQFGVAKAADDSGRYEGKGYLGRVGQGLTDAGLRSISGQAFAGMQGVDTSRLPSILPDVAEAGLAPVTLMTAGAAAPATGGARAISGSIFRRLGLETASGVAGIKAGEYAMNRLPEGTPGPVRAGVGLGAGVLAGGGSFAALDNPRGAARTISRANDRLNTGLARLQGREGQLPTFGLAVDRLDDTADRPLKRPDLARLRHEDLKERPDLFQARDADEGLSYGEARVRNIVENFDQNQLTPGLVVHDSSTGEHIVISGHHRREVQRRMAGAGRFPEEGTWEVIDADLTNPAHVEALQKLADQANYNVAETNLIENLRVYQRGLSRGESHEQIVGMMRSVPKQEAEDLRYIANLPEGVISQVAEQPALSGLAAEIGRGMSTYKFSEADVLGLFNRYRDGGASRTEVRRVIEAFGRAAGERDAARMQGSFGDIFGDTGEAWAATHSRVLDTIDRMARIEAALERSRAEMVTLRNAIVKAGKKDSELAALSDDLLARLDATIKAKEAELSAARSDYAAAIKGRDAGGSSTLEGLPRSDGAAEAPGASRGLFDEPAAPGAAASPEPAVAPVEPVRPVAPPQATFELPPGTERSNPRYSYGAKQFTVAFETDLDRALYIVGGPGKSKAHERFMGALRAYFPDRTDADIVAMGRALRERIKVLARDAKDTTAPLRVKAGQHELGEVERVSTPGEFPKQLRPGAAGTVVETAYNGAEPRRAAEMPLPSGPGEMVVPRTAPVGRVTEGDPRGSRGSERLFGEASGADTPPRAPDAPPPKEPAPREPGLGNRQRAFGQEGERKDFLLGKERPALLAEVDEVRSTRRGRFGERYRGAKRKLGERTTEIVRREYARTNRLIEDTVRDDVLRIQHEAEAVGLAAVEDADGVWRHNGVPLEDIVERTTPEGRAAYEALTPAQKDVVESVRRLNDDVNSTIEAHGGEVPMREDLEQYFPRRVVGREVEGGLVPKNRGGGGQARALGAARIGHRTQDSVEAGVEEGVRYANPWQALEGGMVNKLRMAQDQYIANLISPLAVKEGRSGFGFRPLKGDHPALNKIRVVGETDSGAAMLGTERPVFPNQIADELDDILASQSILNTKPGRVVQAINTLGIPLRASSDVSFILNQGLGLIESSPANAVKGIKGSVEVIRSALGDPQRYAELRRAETARTKELLEPLGITGDDAARWLTQRGKHVADPNSVDDFLFPDFAKDVLRKIPKAGDKAADVIDFSNETFARYLNYARDILANDALERAIKRGLRGEALDREMRKALEATNRMTGWTATKPTGLEQIALFAPRFFRSNIEQIVAAFTKGGMEGEIARRHLVKLTAVAMVAAYGANSVRGYNTDVDPRSHNFMRIRNVAGRDVSLFGPFATIIRGAAQTVAGDAGQASGGPRGRGFVWGTNGIDADPGNISDFARTKASPVLATAWTLMSGRTFDQRPVTADPTDADFYTKTLPGIASENIPFSAQAGIEEGLVPAIRDRDPAALATGAGAFLASSTGAQASAMTPSERRDLARDEVARRLFGASYNSLAGEEKAIVNGDAAVREHQREATRRGLDRDDAGVRAQDEYRTGLDAAAQFLATGQDESGARYTGSDYRETVSDLAAARFNQLKALGEESDDSRLGRYFALRDEATMANGDVNYEMLERLQSEYEAEHPDVVKDIEKFVGAQDDATMRRLRVAREQARAYFAIPAYAGMTVEDAEATQEILAIARDMTSNRQASGYRQALAMLMERGMITQREMETAVRAQRLGTNPERKAYALSHPEFAEFYRNYDEDLGLLGSSGESAGGGASSGYASLPSISASSSRRRRRERRSYRELRSERSA